MIEKSQISLLYGGVEYADWMSYSVRSSLLRAAAGWTLSLHHPATPELQIVEPGGVAELRCNDQTILWGRVDDTDVRGSSKRRTLEIHGRDAGALLIDSSADVSWSWRSALLSVILTQVAAYAGMIRSPVLAYDPVITEAKVEPGESCWDLLGRLVKANGMGMWIAPDGHLEVGQFTTYAPVSGTLRLVPGAPGNNVLDFDIHRSCSDAYSEVTVFGHRDTGAGHSRFRGEWLDLTFPYFKPLVMTDLSLETSSAAQERAAIEGQRAKVSRFDARYGVPGHLADAGLPWSVNSLVAVIDLLNGVMGNYLVVDRELRRSREEGTLTQLGLAVPEDFAV